MYGVGAEKARATAPRALMRRAKWRASFSSTRGEIGWDATPYEQRSKLLKVTRQHYVALLRQFLLDMEVPDADGGEAPRGAPL